MLHVALRRAGGEVDRGRRRRRGARTCTRVLGQMERFADAVRAATGAAHTGARITDVVNIGIGGSDLGPAMAYEALRAFAIRRIRCRFVSNVDGADLAEARPISTRQRRCSSSSSKTFTTHRDADQRASRARMARRAALGDEAAVAATSSRSRPTPRRSPTFGIDTANMFEFWDWVGGRYSSTPRSACR